jgi:hypothetical protein
MDPPLQVHTCPVTPCHNMHVMRYHPPNLKVKLCVTALNAQHAYYGMASLDMYVLAVVDPGFLERHLRTRKFRSHTHFNHCLRDSTSPIDLFLNKFSAKACYGEP